ncbi:AzlC family ABC transporter permease [Pseudoruegeria sp. SHC-113]|uniref:AzlC family ABC transporter permease n=1 Tax=Pseudoruegeria sp. SHC-113 TaxID=2855439 RepID=UPI0021BA7109|nr:AzlC family ABC transporter permease [Pseudoruegeria sp. SHC-113]MCT8158929.1 AzlC family ABC transporter permease [Pseudoruegeria sp. SHC-113]
MPASTIKSAYLRGVRQGLPFLVVIVPFSTLFGVVASEAGLNVAQVLGFSVLVIAGASQFAAVQLLTENAPAVVIIGTALAVNMRMAMYSASLTPHIGAAPLWQRALVAYFLVDQAYAVSMADYEARPAESVAAKVAFFFGAITFVCPFWYAFTLVGALIGASIPADYALDFAVPITFLAVVAPMLRTLAHVAAALTSILLALLFAALPYNLGLLIAALAAMGVGAQVELWLQRKGRWT